MCLNHAANYDDECEGILFNRILRSTTSAPTSRVHFVVYILHGAAFTHHTARVKVKLLCVWVALENM